MGSLAAKLVCVLLVATTALAETRWYRLDLADARAGWRRMDETQSEDQRVWTTTEFLRINRGGVPIEIEAQLEWVDRPDGTPVSMTMTQKMGPQPVRAHWRFGNDVIEITTVQGQRANTVEVPMPEGPWLTPQAAREFVAARGQAGADVIEYRSISPEYGPRALTTRLERIGEGSVEANGRTIPVTSWRTRIEGLPFGGQIQLSKDWRPVSSSMELPFGTLSDVLAGPEVQQMEGGASPELFYSLFVEPEPALEDAHRARRIVMRLSAPDGRPIEVASAGAQSIAGSSDGAVTIVVDPDTPLPARGGEVGREAYLEASSLIDSDDEAVEALMQAATKGAGADTAARAEAMRDHVRRWIRAKGLETAFASASETVRDRTGDCSEHAVLLAAMLRADGIPARVATGLVWMAGIDAFGWHMWTQALIDGVWVDLDATLPMAYSPGHVLVATSPLSDGWGQADLVQLLGLLGNLKIEVIEVRR
ncbi:MAG: transglutaminase-like domain-containing protein [Phycisphaerales bacterium]|nr:transglutaminase-like domain-containing protein [Phycisphaerales bacterium]